MKHKERAWNRPAFQRPTSAATRLLGEGRMMSRHGDGVVVMVTGWLPGEIQLPELVLSWPCLVNTLCRLWEKLGGLKYRL